MAFTYHAYPLTYYNQWPQNMIISYPNLIIQGLASSYYHYEVARFSYLPQEMQENPNLTLKSPWILMLWPFLLFSSFLLLDLLLFRPSSCLALKSLSLVCVCVFWPRHPRERESIDLVLLILPMCALTKVLFHYSILLLSPKPPTLLMVFSCFSNVVAEILKAS